MTQGATERERWQEANAAEPCPICGNKKWCRRSPDGKWVACRREARGAVKTKRYSDGGEAYIHDLQPGRPRDNGTPKRRRPASRGGRTTTTTTGIANEAPSGGGTGAAADGLTNEEAATRDRTYRLLLDALTLSPGHRQDLQRRGLTDEQIDAGGYRTWPKERQSQILAAATVFNAIGNDTFLTVPGLGPGCTEIHGAPGLLIPVRDLAGRIIALVVRLDDPGDGGKYRWLSSRSERNPAGPSPGSPAHVPEGTSCPADTARTTEGQLKADVAYRLSGIPTIGFPGVDSWRRVLPVLQALQVKTVRAAFDADARTNPNVARRLLECVKELQGHGYAVELERWPADAGKGIDGTGTEKGAGFGRQGGTR